MITNIYNGNVLSITSSAKGPFGFPLGLGLIMADGQAYSAAIKPVETWLRQLQHLDRGQRSEFEVLYSGGEDAYQVCAKLNEICAQSSVFSDNWVEDSHLLTKLFEQCDLEPNFELAPIEYSVDEDLLSLWEDLKRPLIGTYNGEREQALKSAMATKSLFEHYLFGMGSRNLPNSESGQPRELMVA